MFAQTSHNLNQYKYFEQRDEKLYLVYMQCNVLITFNILFIAKYVLL